MEIYNIIDYFLFTFFASIGVLQITISNKTSKRFNFGVVIVIIAYFWFFSVSDRNTPTILEGVQLFVVFALGASIAVFITKNLLVMINKK